MDTHSRIDATQTYSEGIDLFDLFKQLWEYRKAILVTGLAIMIFTVGVVRLTAGYKSEGTFIFGGTFPYNRVADNGLDKDKLVGIAPTTFGRMAATYQSSEYFKSYVTQPVLDSSPNLLEISRIFNSKDGIEKNIQPLYMISKEDSKNIVGLSNAKENAVVGLTLSYTSSTPEESKRQVEWLAKYAIDSLLYSDIIEQQRFAKGQLLVEQLRLQGDIIQLNHRLETLLQRSKDLQRIVSQFPDSPGNNLARQIVSIDKQNDQYLPPRTLLSTNEVEIARTKEEIRSTQLKLSKVALMLKYYEAAEPLFQSTVSGQKLLEGLKNVTQELFDEHRQLSVLERDVLNTLNMDNQTMDLIYLKRSRMIAIKTNPTGRPVLAAAAGLMVGLLLASFIVLIRNYVRQQNQTN